MSPPLIRLALRTLGTVALGALLLAAFTPLPNVAYARLLRPEVLTPADAVVVLGAGVSKDGVLGENSLRRALQGILVYRQGLAPLLVMLGPSEGGGANESEVRVLLARDLGLPSASVHAVTGAHTTREEAAAVRALLAARGGRRILLVTGPSHMPRARALFEAQGLEVVPAPALEVGRLVDRPQGRLEITRLLAQEIVARAYHRLAGYL